MPWPTRLIKFCKLSVRHRRGNYRKIPLHRRVKGDRCEDDGAIKEGPEWILLRE